MTNDRKEPKTPPLQPERKDVTPRPDPDEDDELLLAGGFAVLRTIFHKRPRRGS